MASKRFILILPMFAASSARVPCCKMQTDYERERGLPNSMLHESCMSDQQPNRNKAESRIYKCHWRNGARASLTTQQQTFSTKILNVRLLKFTLVTLSINPESSTSPKMPKSKGHRLEKALVVRIFFNCPDGSHYSGQSGNEADRQAGTSRD